MKVRFLEPARAELREAYRYYEGERRGLGLEFVAEIRSAIERIRNYPDAWHPLSENTRRCRTRLFPYGVIYRIRDDGILVVAVAHLHREPTYWKDRG